jgi:hypothetical protein
VEEGAGLLLACCLLCVHHGEGRRGSRQLWWAWRREGCRCCMRADCCSSDPPYRSLPTPIYPLAAAPAPLCLPAGTKWVMLAHLPWARAWSTTARSPPSTSSERTGGCAVGETSRQVESGGGGGWDTPSLLPALCVSSMGRGGGGQDSCGGRGGKRAAAAACVLTAVPLNAAGRSGTSPAVNALRVVDRAQHSPSDLLVRHDSRWRTHACPPKGTTVKPQWRFVAAAALTITDPYPPPIYPMAAAPAPLCIPGPSAVLHSRSNRVGHVGASALGKGLEHNTALTSLDLG